MKGRQEPEEPVATEEPGKGEPAALRQGELEGVSGGGVDSDNNAVGIAGSSTVFSFTGKA